LSVFSPTDEGIASGPGYRVQHSLQRVSLDAPLGRGKITRIVADLDQTRLRMIGESL
jgi:hypothetical protein